MSRVVLILSRKITKPATGFSSRVQLTEYVNNLSELAKTRHGFIQSNSYWKQNINCTNTNEIIETVSLSEWETIEDWKKWKNSVERIKVYNKYKDVIDMEDFSILQKKTPTDDIFLL